MAVTPRSFRLIYTEFANAQAYTDEAIEYWVNDAVTNRLDSCRWGTSLDTGTMLYTAHQLVMRQRAAQAVAVGGTPGQVTGPMASKSIDKVSVSYDTKASTIDGAAYYNQTTYGIEFWQLCRQFGSGPVQVTDSWADPSDVDGSGYWFGLF